MTPALSRTSTTLRRTSAAALLTLVTSAVLAQAQAQVQAPGSGTPPPAGHPPSGAMAQGGMHGGKAGHRQDPAAMQKGFDRRMADLKQALQLTAAQEPAWAQFASAMRPPAQPPAHPDRAALEKMSAPQRIDQMQALRKQHMAEMDKREAAVKTFYATLTPEQQKSFDSRTAQMMRGGHHALGAGDHDHGRGDHSHKHHGGRAS